MNLLDELLATLAAIKQGANFRHVHQDGVRLVTMSRDGFTF
jgi:hypothetical protein